MQKTYAIEDVLTSAAAGYSYRIKAVMKDQSIVYSSSVLLKANQQADELSFYPNPAQHELNLYIGTSLKHAQAMIYDLSGAMLQQTVFTGNNLKLNISKLKPGTYYLYVQQKDGVAAKVHRFVKL